MSYYSLNHETNYLNERLRVFLRVFTKYAILKFHTYFK